MTYEVVRIARGHKTVVASGPRSKMLARLRQLRTSTRRGVSGRMGKKYPVTYEIREANDGEQEEG